jgi:hypothetical protein
MSEPGPPGWYPDPWGTPKQRWFDGAAWTQRVWPPDVTPELPPPIDAPSPVLAEREARIGRLLIALMPIAALAWIAASIFTLAVMRWVANNWNEFVEAAEAGRRLDPEIPSWVSALSWFGQFPLLVIQVLFLVWCYQAARVGRDLGVAARHTPTWAVGSWLIPVLNLWRPYQCIVDSIPPDDRGRDDILRWWKLWLGTLGLSVLTVASAFANLTASIVALSLQGGIAIAAALSARRMIASVLRAHTTAIQR